MRLEISDGKGKGYVAEVTEENRISCDSVILPNITNKSEVSGDAFIVSTGFIALTTTASFNGVLHIDNTDGQNRPFHIHHFRVCSGLGASATSSLQIEIKRNATAGTLISDANAATANTMNTEFIAAFPATAYAASGDGKTVTDGDAWTQFINRAPGNSIQHYDGALILAKGTQFTLSIKPSEAQTVCIELIGYFEQ